MKDGNWIPLSKAFVKDLPLSRPYTRLEAAYSLQYDYDCKNDVTVAGYSALWSWSRTRVSKFLRDMKVEIIYPEKTQKKQNQKGQIAIQIRDRSKTDKRQIRIIENSTLELSGDRSKTDKRQIKDRYGSTTIEPIIPEPKNTISVPLKDGTFFSPDADYLKLLKDTYKNIDITMELNKLIAWNISNPSKQKTAKGIKRHINTWLSGANDKIKPVSKTDISTESWF